MCPESIGYKQRGFGLPATIFIIVILAMIILAMSDLNQASSRAFSQDYQSQRAFYAAESGAQVALNRIFLGGIACTDPMNSINFGDGVAGLAQCAVALECEPVLVSSVTYYTVTSTGTCGTGDDIAQRQIQVRARSE